MKRMILSLVLILFVSNYAQLVGPKAAFHESSYDFGDIEEGIVVEHDFLISNTGGDLLKIEKVRASCGCTAAKPDNNELKPGDDTNIKVSFNTANRKGKQRKFVYVTTNDPDNSEIRFSFTANIIGKAEKENNKQSDARLKIDRYQHNFGNVIEGEKLDWIVGFKNIGKKKLIINDVKPSCGCTAALLNKKEIKPGEKGELKIEFDTSNRSGKMTRTVTLYSNDPAQPRQTITLYINIEKRRS
jgi:uncharacterized cupredoxin-like copper-binding protein